MCGLVRGLWKRKQIKNMLLVCGGNLDAQVIKSTKIPFMCELFGLSCNLGTKPSQGVSHSKTLTFT